MSFINSLEEVTNKNSRTLNGAISNDSSLDQVLDFFSKAGALRCREDEAYQLFRRAFAQDKIAAVRVLFYLRDIRGGQGERSIFKHIFKRLDDDVKSQLTKYIPEYGRWDDMEFNKSTVDVWKPILLEDIELLKQGKQVSLLGKWLPSINTSSYATREKAKVVASILKLSHKNYRKTLSALRKQINILERKMTDREWSTIEYSKLPSQAHRRHIEAFKRHDEKRYNQYIENVKSGDEKINASTLFTYELYDQITSDYNRSNINANQALWNALPDYTNGNNSLVIADVSGSMYGRPMSVSVSLAVYFAEKNNGLFKDYFMTFSERPKLEKIIGNNIYEKFDNLTRADWGMSTNIQAAFDAILNAAVASNARADEIPKTLYIISDMQFNIADRNKTNYEVAREKFVERGYELPHIVFWNVNAYSDSPATKCDDNVTLVSGFNQSMFRYAVEGKTPIESMNDIINSKRYVQITLT